MRDSVMWIMLLVACAVVGILGYRYYQASEQIALLTERTGQLSAELEGVGEVHKLTEAKSAKEVRQAEGDIAKLTRTKDKLRAEVRGLRKKVAKAGEEKDTLKTRLASAKSASQKLQASLEALQAEREKLLSEVTALQTDVKRRQGEVERRGRVLQEQREVLQQRERELLRMKKAIQVDQEALRLWQETAQRLVEEQKGLKAQLEARKDELRQATLLQAERAAEVHQLTETLKDQEERIAVLRRRLAELERRQGQQPTSSTSRSMVPAGR